MLRVGGVGGGFREFDVEFKFAKIQSFYFHEPPPPSLNIGILDFSKFELNIKFREAPPPGERWILVEATFDLGGQCLVASVSCLNLQQ